MSSEISALSPPLNLRKSSLSYPSPSIEADLLKLLPQQDKECSRQAYRIINDLYL